MAPPATPTDRQPTNRPVVLGPSDLTRIFATLAGSARGCGPVEILAAHGYGRSFGLRSGLGYRAGAARPAADRDRQHLAQSVALTAS